MVDFKWNNIEAAESWIGDGLNAGWSPATRPMRICMPGIWYHKNIAELRQFYGQVEYDTQNYRSFHILRFPLPVAFDQRTTLLFVMTPGEHLSNHAGFRFYVNKGLTRPDMASFKHIFEDEGYNDLSEQGFARLSLHLESFKPSFDLSHGDTLLDVVQTVYNFLSLRKGL